jgi:hypothetical protein
MASRGMPKTTHVNSSCAMVTAPACFKLAFNGGGEGDPRDTDPSRLQLGRLWLFVLWRLLALSV